LSGSDSSTLTVELSGPEDRIEAFIELMQPYQIKELARTGVIAMSRGRQPGKSPAADEGMKARKRSIDAPAAASLPPS
jgi:hypothetical protein